jgi:hypothetical protein
VIHSSSSIVLLSLGWGRAFIAVWWWCKRSRSWGGWLTSAGAAISIMTLVTTVETSSVRFIRCCILSGWSFLSTLILSVWSLKEVGVRNHLLLRGDKSLSSRLRHRLKSLSDGTKDRTSRQRIDVDAGMELVLCWI